MSVMSTATFGEFLNRHSLSQWNIHYINYEGLKLKLKKIRQNKINSEKAFVDLLESEYEKYKRFIDTYVQQMEATQIKKEDMVEIIQMNSFMSHNQESLKEIIKKHDDISKIKLWGTWKFRIKYKPFYKLLKALHKVSDLYKVKEEKGGEKDYDNESFVRKSKKFWVRSDKIVPLIAEIIKHLPVYIFEAGDEDEENTETSLDQEITSVYFDNDNLDVWRARVNKEDGSKLVRIRYYGDDNEKVFVERKIHRDTKATNEESSKDRFTLDANEVIPYLRGHHQVKGKKSSQALSEDIHSFLSTNRAYPFVRTVYKRIAFQLEASNAVRLSLDLDMKMIKEAVNGMEWITPYENLTEAEIYNFPFGVLEVKLQGEHVTNPPEWIADIMANSDLTIPENNFSKFGHAVYMFHSQTTGQVPSWCDTHDDVFGPHRRMSADSAAPRKFSSVINRSPLQGDEEDQFETISTPLLSAAHISQNSRESEAFHEPSFFQRLAASFRGGAIYGAPPSGPRHGTLNPSTSTKGGKAMKVEPKTFFSNERTFLHWYQSGVLMVTVGLAAFSVDQDGADIIGTTLCALAFLILFYASYTYKRRNYILKNKIMDVELQDEWGPIGLVACLVVAVIVNIIIIRPHD